MELEQLLPLSPPPEIWKSRAMRKRLDKHLAVFKEKWIAAPGEKKKRKAAEVRFSCCETVAYADWLEWDYSCSSGYAPGKHFGFSTAVGVMHENNTVLGAMSDGLLDMGNGDTMYVDSEFTYSPTDYLSFKLRSTFARTTTDATGQFIMGMSDIDSNAFGFGIDAGNFSFSVAQPLAVSRGVLTYPYAEYEIVNNGNGDYDLNIVDTHIKKTILHGNPNDSELYPNTSEFTITEKLKESVPGYSLVVLRMK